MSTTAPLAAPTASPSRALHIGLWVAQGLLALAFLGAGGMKLVTPLAELQKNMGPDANEALIRFIGVSEVAGALGMILPAASRIKPWLTPLAALGLLTIMILAIGVHLSKGEASHTIGPIILGALAAFVAWGRWKLAPIPPKA